MACEDNNYTITFDEKVKGWTSFHSYFPDFMIGMNNQFFSFHNGNLHIHHSDKVERNTYYGVQYPSKISMMFNDNPSDIKELKTISLEGNSSWETLLKAYVSSVDEAIISTIKEIEFIKKEGIWYAHARRNENSLQEDSKSTYGIGRIMSINNNTLMISGVNSTMNVGDKLVKGSDFTIIGMIESVVQNKNTTIINMSDVTGINVNDFVIGMKNPRIEGGNLRGYTIRCDLEITKNTKVELFAVNAEVIKSYQ